MKKDRKKFLSQNKGLSLIELLLFFVIAAMILAMMLISYNVINKADAAKSAHRLETVLKTARTTAMGKGRTKGTLTLTNEGGNIYATLDGNKEFIGGGGVFMYTTKNALCNVIPTAEFASGTSQTIIFETSGKLRMVGLNTSTSNIFKLKKGKRNFIVTVFPETGYIEVTNYTEP